LVPLLSSIVREQKARKVNPKREKREGMRDGYQRKMKEIFTALKRRAATVMGVILAPTRLLERAILRAVHHAPVIQTVKQTVKLFKKRYTEM
jgi:hypothetical protein